MVFTDEELRVMKDALLDTQRLTHDAMNLWAGHLREKHYRDQLIVINDIIEKVLQLEKEQGVELYEVRCIN